MLKRNLKKKGYDWWWHSFVAQNKKTGEVQPFFIEYYFVNPALHNGSKIVKGQSVENKTQKKRPSYAMMKAGTWTKNGAFQVSNFYAPDNCSYNYQKLDVKVGNNQLTETNLKGSVTCTTAEALLPENLSESGSISWNLTIHKKLHYSLGYGPSAFMRFLNAFKMYWHIQGMYSELEGTIICNGDTFLVKPENSYGYQDKNWGTDYTNPWVWLNCNHFISTKTKQELPLTSLDLGGGRPVVFGLPLNRKVLVAFYYKGELFEYNFSKFWKKGKVDFTCSTSQDSVYWKVVAQSHKTRTTLNFSCPKSHMLRIKYENPKGEFNHTNLYNGGHASGTLLLEKKTKGKWVAIDELYGDYGGCEYGEYPR